MTLRASLFAGTLAAVLVISGVQHAAFISGVWQGDANYDGNGKFSDCTMTAQVESGVLIGFIISRDYNWGLVIVDETRSFKVGTAEPVALVIDQRDPIPALAKVIDVHGILIPLEDSDPVVEALREGKVLTIVGKAAKFSFKLTGTKAAIAELAACVAEHVGSEKVERPGSAPGKQLFDIGELELDIGRTAMIALSAEGRLLHIA